MSPLWLRFVLIFASLLTPLGAWAVVKPMPQGYLRLQGEASQLKSDLSGKKIAFTDPKGFNLRFLDLTTKKVYKISKHKVDGSFFWSPNGFRIFYRELVTGGKVDPAVYSVVKVYDVHLKESTELDRFKGLSGYLTFDPRDLRFNLMHAKGVLQKRISFPGERLAKWQLAQRTDEGKFIGSQKSMLWLSHAGFTMRRLLDDESGIQSFDISPDGSSVVWATFDGQIYLSRGGSHPAFIALGLDPKWHPESPIFVFSGIRKIGTKIVGHDLRLSDSEGKITSLTATGSSQERWPVWVGQESVVYSLSGTTDLYQIRLK